MGQRPAYGAARVEQRVQATPYMCTPTVHSMVHSRDTPDAAVDLPISSHVERTPLHGVPRAAEPHVVDTLRGLPHTAATEASAVGQCCNLFRPKKKNGPLASWCCVCNLHISDHTQCTTPTD